MPTIPKRMPVRDEHVRGHCACAEHRLDDHARPEAGRGRAGEHAKEFASLTGSSSQDSKGRPHHGAECHRGADDDVVHRHRGTAGPVSRAAPQREKIGLLVLTSFLLVRRVSGLRQSVVVGRPRAAHVRRCSAHRADDGHPVRHRSDRSRTEGKSTSPTGRRSDGRCSRVIEQFPETVFEICRVP
jgi:hypothetical protein